MIARILSGTRGLKRFIDIGKISSGGADDAQPPHIDSLHIQFDCPTAMGARGHEPSAHSETVERFRPERWVGNVFANDVDTLAVSQFHYFFCKILLAIIDAEVRAITLCRVNSFIRACSGDDFGAEHLGDLNAGTAQGAGCAHDQDAFSGLDVGFAGQKIERHGKVARDDCPLRKGDFVGKFHCIARRQGNKLCVTAPEINSNTFAVNAIGFFAFEALVCTVDKGWQRSRQRGRRL